MKRQLVADRSRLLDHLKRSRRELEQATTSLSPEQWNFKSAPDRWSIAECYEHIAATEDFLFDLITGKVLKAPARPEKIDPERQSRTNAEIARMVVDRTNRVKAIEPLQPANRYGSPKASQEYFAISRKRTIEFVESTKEDLGSHFIDHPAIKNLDGYGWLLFLSGHTQRHTAQISEVKANPDFPKQ